MMALKIEVSSLAYVIIRPSTVLIYVLKHYVGNVYVFTGSGSSWTFVTKLLPSNAANDNHFGDGIGIYGTTTLMIASPLSNDGAADAGK